MPGFNDIHKFINAGLWPRSWPRPGPMNLLETDLRHVQDFVLSTNNEYLLVSVRNNPPLSLSLPLLLSLSLFRSLTRSISLLRSLIRSLFLLHSLGRSLFLLRSLTRSLSFLRSLARSLSLSALQLLLFSLFFSFLFYKVGKSN